MLDTSFLTLPLAHRGLHDITDGRPENSRAAINAAIASGYGIEIDLQLSSDGQAMVFHDYALNRLTAETGPVRGRTTNELGSIPLKGARETIPTLSEILTLVAGQVPLLIELKDQDGSLGEGVGALEQATAKALRTYAGPVAVMSFNPHSMAAMAEYAPDVPRGLVTDGYSAEDWPLLPEPVRAQLRQILDYDRVQACFISHGVNDLEQDRVGELKQQGVPILCWTVRSSEQETKARKVADNITFEGYLPDLPA